MNKSFWWFFKPAGGRFEGSAKARFESWFLALQGPDFHWRELTRAASDAAGIDVENLACRADAGECRGVRSGHPDLRAEFCQFIEQRHAPDGIKMRNHFVEQQ